MAEPSMLRLLLIPILLCPSVALACSIILEVPSVGLPGPNAGPSAVWTLRDHEYVVDPLGRELMGTRTPFLLEGTELFLFVPAAPLMIGRHDIAPCERRRGECTTTIALEGDHLLVPTTPELLDVEHFRVGTGRDADCGPRVAATGVELRSDALAVLLATEPVTTLAGAALLATPGEVMGGASSRFWSTQEDVTIYAAAIDAEGDLSAWTEPIELKVRGCSSTGGDRDGLALLTLLLFLAGTLRARGRACRW